MENIAYSWEQTKSDTIKICNWVREVNFKPDFIVGITRGGGIPAIIASHQLNVPAEFIEWSTRDTGRKDHHALDGLEWHIARNYKVLFIDDIIDSGITIAEIKKELMVSPDELQRNVLFTALWYNPSQTNTTIHYWANMIDRNVDKRWIIYPWE